MMVDNLVHAEFRSIANFTSHYSAIIDVFDTISGDNSRDMRVTLIYKNLPIILEDEGGMWLGIGFGSNTMLGADIVICQWDDSLQKGKCGDYIADSTGHPANIAALPADEVNNIRYVSGVKADNMLEIKFRRYLQTGDSDDHQMSPGEQLDLVWAFGFPDRLYHGSSNRGNQTVLLDQTVESGAFDSLCKSFTQIIFGLILVTIVAII
ncbi:UNKNOWN [Stylonychia lemnae]|uniref:DOMON domain-containing protein n=1 Tax=Stylonychia lemnae TaxID=5949 RepID=A0A078AKG4_STYLE|nr:UNKNOWN [Stylonychia lemnae]|eukprot:CDW81912.1 UNKNOWN [Stylonychia lemnae]